MHDVVILGAAGHAKVCIEVLRATGLYRPWHALVPNSTSTTILGVPILRAPDTEGLAKLRSEGVSSAFVALGANRVRDDVGAVVERAGFTLITAVDPDARLSPSAASALVYLDARSDRECGCRVRRSLHRKQRGCHRARLSTGSCCHVGPGAVLAGNVTLGDRAFIGVGAVVRPDTRIGADAVAGAGAAVVSDVAECATVVGVPARPLKATNSP